MSDEFDPTFDEARAHRDIKGCGIHEAKRELRRENMLKTVRAIYYSQDDIRDRFDRLLAVVEALVRDE